mmetsp:Transcript_25945/g.72391  ORF Transcript_25945/g.72391 Transcript_25945/m.72391 type:complete len:970 (+) Transcript_25945:96-3005(+)
MAPLVDESGEVDRATADAHASCEDSVSCGHAAASPGAHVSIEALHEAISVSVAAACDAGLTSEAVCWERLVCDAGFEALVGLLRAILGVVVRDDVRDDVRRAVSRVFNAAVTRRAACATFALGGYLAGMRAAQAKPLAAVARATLLSLCCLWLDAGALETTVALLVHGCGGGDLQAEAEVLCTRWLCSFADHLAPLWGRPGSEERGGVRLGDWLERYAGALVAALLKAWHSKHHDGVATDGTDGERALDLLAQLARRGDAARIAAGLCVTCLQCSEGDAACAGACDFGGSVLLRLAETSATAACSVAGAVLDACDAMLSVSADGTRLRAASDKALCLMPALLGRALASQGPIHFHLQDRVWRLGPATRLNPAVVFCVVDMLREQSTWMQVRSSWFERWSDAGMLKSADLPGERLLALRVARALRGHAALDGPATHLLLKGVHVRLGAPTAETRWIGMAVAEIMARAWQHAGVDTSSGAAELRFDGFDIAQCGLSEFKACDADLQVDSEEAPFEAAGPAASMLRALLQSPISAEQPLGQRLASRHEHNRFGQSDGRDEAPGPQAQSGGLGVAHAAGSCDEADDVDSDDEDDDDPLRGLASLPPLHAPLDACEDLLLARPPGLLRTAYEMLLGPAKDESARSALVRSDGAAGEDVDNPSRPPTQDPPAIARARVLAALGALPGLVRANPPDLPSLAEPLCARVLHMDVDTSGAEDAKGLRRSCLAALAATDGSRRPAVRFLISEFASDVTLAARVLVLDALSDAARAMSHNDMKPSTCAPARGLSTASRDSCAAVPRAGPSAKDAAASDAQSGALGSRTRRFASATRDVVSQPNYFAAEMKLFIFPLLARWSQPDDGAGRWAVSEPLVLGPMLQCLGVLLECGGSASPDRDAAATACLDIVEAFLAHGDPYVRRCALFLLSRVLLVGAGEQFMLREMLLIRLEPSMWSEGDETCRNMLGGILTWVRQHSVI